MTWSPSVCCPLGPSDCPHPSLTPPVKPFRITLLSGFAYHLQLKWTLTLQLFHLWTKLEQLKSLFFMRLLTVPAPHHSPQSVLAASRGASAGAAASRAVCPWLSSPGVVSPVVSDWLAGLLPAGRTRGTILRLGGGTPNALHSGKTDWNKMFKPISGAKTVTLISFGFGKHLQSCKNAMLMEEVKSIDIWALSPILGSTTQFGLIWVKQKSRTGFSKGWQGSPEGFLEQGSILRAKI